MLARPTCFKAIIPLVAASFMLCVFWSTTLALPQDAKRDIGRYAPKHCDVFLGWTGELKPDLSGSTTERWLAQPEIMDLFDEIKDMTEQMASQAEYDDAFMAKVNTEVPWMVLQQPWAIYVEQFTASKPTPTLILSLGDKEEWMAELLAEFEEKNEDDVETIEVEGQEFKSYQGLTDVSEYGIVDGHLLLSFGTGTLKSAIANLKEKSSPKWFVETRKELTVDRLAGLLRLDLANIILEATAEEEAINPDFHLEEFEEFIGVVGVEDGELVTKGALHCPKEIQGDFMKALDSSPLSLEDVGAVPDSVNTLFVGQVGLPHLWNFFAVTNEDTHDDVLKFSTDMLTQYGLDIEKDVVNGFDGFALSYQKISLLNPAGSGIAYLRVNDAKSFEAKLKKIVEKVNDESEDFVIEENENKSGIVYSVQPIEPALGGPSFHFSLVGDQVYLAADPKAISSHLRKAKRATGKLIGNERFKALFDNSKNGGLGEPIAAHYLDLASVLELVYGMVPMLAGGPLADSGFDVNILPPVNVVTNGLDPNVMGIYRTDKGFQMVERGTLPGVTSTMPLMIGMLLPAIQQVRSAARRAVSSNNIRQIILACHNFEANHGKLPSAYTKNDKGERLLSWRVHLLPYMEQEELYEKFHLDEPWDSPHNKALISEMPAGLGHPGLELAEGETVYLGVSGKDGVFAAPGKAGGKNSGGIGFGAITDGTSNTIMIIEANRSQATIWTKPDDFDFAEVDDIGDALKGNWPGGSVLAGFADGSCQALDPKTHEEMKNMMTRNGGEKIDR